MMGNFNKYVLNFMLFLTALFAKSVTAEDVLGQPKNWAIDLQLPVSTVAKDIYDMHFFVLILMTLITLFVLGLILWVCYRYSENRNKN